MPTIDSDLGQGVQIYLKGDTGLAFFGSCNGTPPTTASEFEGGAIFVDTDAKIAYINTGTTASPVWNSMHEIATADIADAAVTPVKTIIVDAVTATSDGATTGIVPDNVNHITITSASANNIVTLPEPVVGLVIHGHVGANGCELRTDAAGDKINDVDCGGASNEAAIPATSLIKLTCVSATEWILEATTELGATITAIVPDAV